MADPLNAAAMGFTAEIEAAALSGDLLGVAVILVRKDGNVRCMESFADGGSMFLLAGSSILQRDMLARRASVPDVVKE